MKLLNSFPFLNNSLNNSSLNIDIMSATNVPEFEEYWTHYSKGYVFKIQRTSFLRFRRFHLGNYIK